MKKLSFSFLLFFFSLKVLFSLNFSAEEVLLTPYKDNFLIYLSGDVFLEEDNFILQADSFKTLEENSTLWQAKGNVKFHNKEETLFIRSQEFLYDSMKNSFVASQESELQEVEKGIFLSAIEISFTEFPFIIRATGAVSLSLKDIYAQSDFLRYDRDSNTLELIGNASLEKEGSTLEAYRIWVNLSNDQIILEEEVKGSFELVKDNKRDEL